MSISNTSSRIPSRLVVVAGTYDGVLVGWDTVEHSRESDENDVELRLLRRNDGRHLKLSFAMAGHDGSVRCIDIASAGPAAAAASVGGAKAKEGVGIERSEDGGRKRRRGDGVEEAPEPGALLSGGYDETVNVFSLQKRSQVGELRTPSDLGSPLCCSFAPPCSAGASSLLTPTHALVGLTSGKVVLYRRRNWSVQHVLSGHDGRGGARCLAVHPTGRMALTGGGDGKLVLWDLTRGRMAYVHKLPANKGGRAREAVNHIAWSGDGSRYAFCYGNKITSRDVAGGEDLLDVSMPSRVNQVAFVGGPEGMFLAAACDDGGLPVLEVGKLEETDDEHERRAIMAIEPVEGVVAGEDRFKCIRSVEGGSGFLVVTANSGGVVSLMDLEGAARMMLTGGRDDEGDRSGGKPVNDYGGDFDSDSASGSDEEIEAAVEILDSVRIGSGARITELAVWSFGGDDAGELSKDANRMDKLNGEHSTINDGDGVLEGEEKVSKQKNEHAAKKEKKGSMENKSNHAVNKIELDSVAVKKARKLVGQAKKRQSKKKQKMAKKS